MDFEDDPLQDFSLLMKSVSMGKFYRLNKCLEKIPLIRSISKKYLYEHLMFRYDLSVIFIESHQKAQSQIDEVKRHKIDLF